MNLIEQAQGIAGVKQDGVAGPITLSAILTKFGGVVPEKDGMTDSAYRKRLVRRIQIALGFAESEQDGVDGRMTWAGILNKMGVKTDIPAPTKPPPGVPLTVSLAGLDPHTAKWLPTLHPKVQPLALAHWQAARAAGMPFRITSGIRSYAESDRLYWEHTHNHGPQAVPGGYSFHNFDEEWGGLAYDFTLWDEVKNKPLWDSVPGGPNYVTVAKLGETGGMYAGFHFGDEPHMEFHPPWAAGFSEGQITAELRKRHASHTDPCA